MWKDKEDGGILPQAASVSAANHTGPSTPGPKAKHLKKWQWITLACLSTIFAFRSYIPFYERRVLTLKDLETFKSVCPQVTSQTPSKSAGLHARLKEFYSTEEFKTQVVNWLSGAIQVPTESHDSMGPIDEDPRWKVFGGFHDYLSSAYPLIHTNLKLTKVNTYGLVYHWQGTDMSLKPLLLTAHQDVVPIDPLTVDQWIHPPYSGHYDGNQTHSEGTYIWGRGSSDDKSGLISLMSAVETLLGNEFKPTRSVVLAFGFDEETSGLFGAYEIGKYLLQAYGENGFAFIVDEGGSKIDAYGAQMIVPATSEKGYLDVGIQVNTAGGHSSRPPKHTSIGIIASLLVALEQTPPKSQLTREQAAYETIQCFVHAPEISKSLTRDIIRSQSSDKALRRVEKEILTAIPDMKYVLGTTQAIDLITGGVKVNALPEQVTAVVNHRIDTGSSVDTEKERVSAILKPVVEDYNLSLTSFGKSLLTSSLGSVVISDAFDNALEPAPKTPTVHSEPWSVLSAAIRATIEESEGNTNNKVVIAPGVMTGNTDTRYYWQLTPHIFRYSHRYRENAIYSGGSIHSVNEAVSAMGIVDYVRFFTLLILNTDESETV